MRKHIFKTSNICFFIRKINVQNILRYWSYATHRKTFFRPGSNAAHVAGLNPIGLAGSLAQTSDPVGQTMPP
jgi:hypothetical protein